MKNRRIASGEDLGYDEVAEIKESLGRTQRLVK